MGWRWVQDPNGCRVEVGAEALWLWGEDVQDLGAMGWRWVQEPCGRGVRVCRTPIPIATGWRWV